MSLDLYKGVQGPQGVPGVRGLNGVNSRAGSQGNTGPPGETGPRGAMVSNYNLTVRFLHESGTSRTAWCSGTFQIAYHLKSMV